ncbi:MAG: hypothetical protein RLZZ546_1689 [Bacteroidota bacterium]|jgi:hypothetical protein
MYLKIGFNFNKSQTPIFFNLQSLRDSVYTSAIMSIDLRLIFFDFLFQKIRTIFHTNKKVSKTL